MAIKINYFSEHGKRESYHIVSLLDKVQVELFEAP